MILLVTLSSVRPELAEGLLFLEEEKRASTFERDERLVRTARTEFR